MKILFRADGSSKKGMGDIYDTFFIAEQFIEDEIAFVSIEKEDGYNFLSRTKRKVIPIYSKSPYKEIEEMRAILKHIDPTVVVLFTPNNYPESYYSKFRELSKEILLLGRYSPYVPMEKYVDIVLDYGDPQDKLAKSHPFYFGPQYIPLSPVLRTVKTHKKEYAGAQQILVFFGGGDFANATEKALRALSVLKENLTFHVVIGEANPHSVDEEKYPGNFKFYRAMEQYAFLELLSSLDLAIVSGGNTAFELAYFGVPAILYAMDEHQDRNINILANRGFAVNMGHIFEFNPNVLLDNITKVINDKGRLLHMSQVGPKVVDGLGAQRIKELIVVNMLEKRK